MFHSLDAELLYEKKDSLVDLDHPRSTQLQALKLSEVNNAAASKRMSPYSSALVWELACCLENTCETC